MTVFKSTAFILLVFFSLQTNAKPLPFVKKPVKVLTPLRLNLDWYPSVEFAGLLAAKEAGLFKKAGINLILNYNNLNSVPDIVAGRADIGMQSAHDVIRYVSKGYPLKAFAAKYQKNPHSIMVPKDSGIKSIKDLKGKTLGMFIQHDYNFYKILLAQYGLTPKDVKFRTIKTVEHKDLIHLLKSGKVDALVGWEFNWTLAFPMQGLDLKVFPGHKNGFHYYGIVYYGMKDYIDKHPQLLAKFLKISFAGWKKVYKRPDYYANLIVNKYVPKSKYIGGSKKLTLKHQLLELKLRQRYLFEGVGENRIGMMTDFAWQHSLDISKKHNLLGSNKNIRSKDLYDSSVLNIIYGVKF